MKILLVDDSKSARYALRLQLQKHGIEVEIAESAEDAFAKLKSSLPDVIFMDHLMPGLNGFEALDILRQDPHLAAIPVVMCTSQEEDEFAEQARAKGAFAILPKSSAPERLPDLLDRLKAALAAASVAPAPVVSVPPEIPVAAPAGLSEEAVSRLIETQLAERLPRLLTPLLEELRRDLTEALRNETRRLIDEARAADQSAPPRPTLADLQAMATHLTTETLPDLIRRTLQTERAQIQDWVNQKLSEILASRTQDWVNAEEIAHQVVSAAQREVRQAEERVIAQAQQVAQTLEQRLRNSLGLIYGLLGFVALLGLGAAGAVYYLLTSPLG
ncbi:response regulator [Caldichromatium japonicum]|uniref:Response regulator n=1 Tax=Caldichromatium japonicum TaxID=2699430 RepID=A0A6G7VAI6_9GAMM|nr:response regulator [Caldichromatium japonicum]QIK37079.1 response regulator [Caldichromatium japonicum]